MQKAKGLPSHARRLGDVEAFVLRARRVMAHSLTRDARALEQLAGGATFVTKVDGIKTVEHRLPDEEVLESLAARVRPLLLRRERVHHGRVLNSLRALLIDAGETRLAAECSRLKKLWKIIDPATGDTTYYASVRTIGSDEPLTESSDGTLATAWFYGDLVHADYMPDTARFGINTRFAAAAVRTAQIALTTQDTLALIRYCHDEGLVVLDQSAFDAGVSVNDEATQEGASWDIHLAHPGTAAPSHDEPFGPEWRQAATWDDEDDGEWFVHISWGLDARSD